ncbi:MAG TPA: LPS biosynthesis protein WbpP, partial [Ferruginibacter sp.]|nr:LPS biosynthesis protein WbpP [Ferruginibacter sp.]
YETCKSQLNSDWEATYREPRHGDIRHSQADISLAKGLLDYQPTKKFEAGLIDTIDYFKTVYSN